MTKYSEIWKPITGFDNSYQISNLGNVKSKSCLIRHYTGLGGYPSVNLWKNGKQKAHYVHRLVALHFLTKKGNVVNHIDENKLNCNASNLEWVTQSQNVLHSYEKHSTRKTIVQVVNGTNEITEWESITQASKNGYSRAGIAMCLRGVRKTHKNSTWKIK